MFNYEGSSYDVTEALRKLANSICPGTVNKVRHSPYAVKVRVGTLITTWLPVIAHRAGNNTSWHPLEEGEQVLVFSPDGNIAQGWVLGGCYSQAFPAPSANPDKTVHHFSDGGRFEYDRKAHHLDINLPAGATVNLNAVGGITFTGDLLVNGNITATKDITDKTRSMAADRDIYNQHQHKDVMPGQGTSGTPEQTQ
ncbi:phage baseplate assembly protein V [Candidatus Sororendozoicomonas aggregata]|uniref:phage baseplate assembly protein V n=1 Tax=Candidatus Sororendozoicomonas aggregata TaxID=3073239 RepID=UPI002ED30F86